MPLGPVFSVGLEQGPEPSEGTRVHALDLLGCAADGDTPQAALESFQRVLAEWLGLAASLGESVPPPETELEITVDEWLRTGADVAAGQSEVCFAADLRRLADHEMTEGVRRLGDLRGRLLRAVRSVPAHELDADRGAGYAPRRVLDELARAQWWLLSRLGASPLAEVPPQPLARLDTAMALVVDRFTTLPADRRSTVLDLDGESWTPRKVLRRLLWLEWSLGGAAIRSLTSTIDR